MNYKKHFGRSLILSLLLSGSLIMNAQNVTYQFKNVPLKTVLKEVEKQLQYSIIYKKDVVNEKKLITVDFHNTSVEDVLSSILDEDLVYSIQGKMIIISKKELNHAPQQSAKQRTITGVIKDGNGEPLIGANVTQKGTSNGTITDIDGKFSLTVPEGSTLTITYIGYTQQNVKLASGQSNLNITLKEDNEMLDEVVVVGYGIQKKVNLTGAVETIKSDRFANKPVTSIVSALTGEAAGVTVTQSSGQPGPSQGSIRIRGIGTWDSAAPLVLVDGVSMSLNDVIPSEVESVSVLKDAASAAIYGSRAANGVILITTKKGQEGKLSFNYSGNVGFQFATRTPKMAASWQYAELYNQLMANEGKSSSLFPQDRIERMKAGGDPDVLEGNTDWYDEILRKGALQHNHQLSVSGGNNKVTYMASAGYSNQQGILPSTKYERYNLRINTSAQLTSWLKMNINLSYLNGLQEESSAGAGDAYRRAGRGLPYMPVKFSDGTWSYSTAATNPVRRVSDDYGMRKKYNDLTSLLISPEIKVLEGLVLKGTFGYESSTFKEKKFSKIVNYDEFEPAGQSEIIQVSRNKQSDRWDQYKNLTANVAGTYEKTLERHYLKVMGGGSLETFKWAYTQASRQDFPNNDFSEINAGDASTATAAGNSTYEALASLFGRINYAYADRYLFEFTARYDGSSKFARGHRWGFFPSVSLGWRISEENFFEPLKKHINNLKLRASWGELGNQNISNHQFLSTIGNGGSYIFGNQSIIGYKELSMGNTLITWESSKSLDLGMDIGLLDNRLQATFDWYRRITSGLLLSLAAPATLGISPAMENAGEIENKGWELTLNWRSKISKNFKYNIGFNLSDVKNKILDLHGYKSATGSLTARIEGEPLNAIFGWKTLGICETQEEYEKYAEVMKTYDPRWGIGDIIIDDMDGNKRIDAEDKTVIGNSIPRFTYGLNLGFEYKGLDFSCFFQGVGKADGYVTEEAIKSMGNNSARVEHYEETFNPANPKSGAYFPRVLSSDYNYGNMSHWVQDASYLRLKNLQIGYSFNVKGFSKFRVYVSGQNLFTITKFRTWDPETAVNSRGSYPHVAVYSCGVNLNF